MNFVAWFLLWFGAGCFVFLILNKMGKRLPPGDAVELVGEIASIILWPLILLEELVEYFDK